MDEAIAHTSNKLRIDKPTSQQQRALTSFLQGNDVFVSLPTGSGKSFIFQAAPICLNYVKNIKNSVALVISPIKTLVDDQEQQLKGKGVSASFVGDVNTKVVHPDGPRRRARSTSSRSCSL